MIAQGDLHAALVSMPAVHQVLDTYELLENILMHLPLRRLLLAQRVNTSFRDLIYRSANINRVLFFNAATTESVDWYRTTDVQPSRESPYRGEWKTELSGKTVRPIMNPFVPVYQYAVHPKHPDCWLMIAGLRIASLWETRQIGGLRLELTSTLTTSSHKPCCTGRTTSRSQRLHDASSATTTALFGRAGSTRVTGRRSETS